MLFFVAACENGPGDRRKHRAKHASSEKYGGLFRMNLTDEIRSIFPHNLVDASAFSLMNQVYEGLVKFDRVSKEVLPSLAERYEVSADGMVYRFYIREGVYFHEDQIFGAQKTREMTAEDVAFCLRKLCEPSDHNQLYAFVIDVIKGARDYYEKGPYNTANPKGPKGIRVIGDNILELELEYPSPNFLTVLTHPCCWVFPRELYQYGKEVDNWCIGTGPFRGRTIKMNDVIILERNFHYWREDKDGNALPYLDAIRCNFVANDRQQLKAFFNNNLDIIFKVPFDDIESVEDMSRSTGSQGSFELLSSPGLRVEYYGFQHRGEPYGDPLVRKAFNLAVDRDRIVKEVLKGYATPAHHGFVPPSMPGYTAENVEGFRYDVRAAREALAEAGYPGGQGFPVVSLQLNDGNETALKVADVIQGMLGENLGLTVELSVLSRDRHYDRIEAGEVGFWRDGWIADYPDPENFLRLFHGKLVPDDSVKASYLNTVRFKDDVFDEYFESAMRENNREQRMELYANADQQLIENAAVVPLYYEEWIWLVSNKVKNLMIGGMGEIDLSPVYFEKDIELP